MSYVGTRMIFGRVGAEIWVVCLKIPISAAQSFGGGQSGSICIDTSAEVAIVAFKVDWG